MTIVHIPARRQERQRQEYRVHSVTARSPVAMTVERLNGLGETQTIVTEVQEKLNWGLILSIAIPLAIIIPMLLSGMSSEEK